MSPIVLINPGTEGRVGSTLANAEAILHRLCTDVGLPRESVVRNADEDLPGGFFGFTVSVGAVSFPIQVPGDDPAEFHRSEPFRSRRMYVDGSSWLYGYALSAIYRLINPEGKN